MYSLSLGNSTTKYSRLKVPGLPALIIPVSKGGYLDGFVCFAKSLRQMYLTQNYENIYNVALTLSYENLGPRQQLTQYPIGGLAALHLMRSWARVQIVARPTSSKLTVYFVDTGEVQDVDVGNLYEMPSQLRNTPPLAIPITLDNGEPEVDSMELLKLRGAKVAVKLEKVGHTGAFQVSEFTVFERNTNSNLEVMEALKDPDFLARVSRSQQQIQPIAKVGAVTGSTALVAAVATTAGTDKSEINWAVLVIAVICVIAFLIVICVAVFYFIRKVKQNRRAEQQQQDQAEAANTAIAPSIANPTGSTRATERYLDETRIENSILPLQADALAVVAAVIALSNVEKDKEMRERNKSMKQLRVQEPPTQREEPATQPDEQSTRTRPEEQSTRTEEHSARPEDMSVNRRASYIYENRRAAGLSDISSIGSDDPAPFPRCSTPVNIFTPLRAIRPSPVQRLPDVVPEAKHLDTSEASGYSGILDVHHYVPRNSLDQTGRFSSSSQDGQVKSSNDTMYVTAPWGSSSSSDNQNEENSRADSS